MSTIRTMLDELHDAADGLARGRRDAANGASHAAQDLLALGIVDIAAHYGAAHSVISITAGLPLVKGALPLEHAELAAERAGLQLGIEDINARQLHASLLQDYELPLIMVTGAGDVEILWKIARDASGAPLSLTMSLPGQRAQAISVSPADLENTQYAKIIRLRPRSALDERGHAAMPAQSRGWFLRAFRESRPIYAQAILATIAINLLALAVPLFSMNVYDRVLPNAAEATLWALAIGVMIAIAFDFIIRTLRALFVDAASRRADVRLSGLIYGRLLGARLQGQTASTGVRANTMREFETLREFLNSASLTAFGDLPFMVLFLVIIWVIAGPLMFVVAASVPVILAVGWITQRSLQKLIQASFQEAAQKNAHIVETLVGLEAIKAAGAESWAAQKWETSVAEHVRTGNKIRHVTNLGQHLVHALQTSVQVLIVVFGFYMVAAGELTMGALIATTILSGRALAPLAQAAGLLGRVNQARIAYTSLSEIVNAEQERVPAASYLSKSVWHGEIIFDQVGFGYDPDSPPALQDVSFKIAPGERVALIGGIGSGKTTALKLMHNFYRPVQGRVLLDGTSVSQVEPAVLRANVALHLQGAELFHGTIRQNITIGAPGASDHDIIEAAKVSGALDWITALPLGFDTPVRERGAGLSGGQCQSVALARTLLGPRKVLLLDEPTSEMDGRTEQVVIKRLRAACRAKTLIIVTHRPSLLALVDRIIILEQGKILQDGAKDQIMQQLKALSNKRTNRQGAA